jgi:DNA-binding SARP family transcriptional activator/tetratricopeptide (TPR) repeat protein
MELLLLGPVEARMDGGVLPLGPRKQKLVLAALALQLNRVVSVGRLVELAWPGEPPRTAEHAVRVFVSHLRAVLGPQAGMQLTTEGNGYVLRAERSHVDVHRFRTLVEQASAADGDSRCVELLDEALALWRGPALGETADGVAWAGIVHALEEERLLAVEERIDARLRQGRHREVLAELTGLVEDNPSRQRMTGQLMLALYRCSRGPDALALARRTRARLVEEDGADPAQELRDLEVAILREDPALQVTAATYATATPRQLPLCAGGFTGRGREIAALDAMLADDADRPPVVVTAIAGTAGVGKSALTVYWAHRVSGRFPDGQLFVNLRGYASGPPMPPVEALGGFLRALGVSSEHVPADVDEASAMYRSLLAGQQVLVVLDNAASAGQVRPLLPGSAGCAVVVTSRNQLRGLVAADGARRITLDVLSDAEATGLLQRLLGANRVAAEPDAASELARACGHLPLALRLAAANLLDRPAHTIAGYLAELQVRGRLNALAVPGDPEGSVRAAFDLSYTALEPESQRMFRLLGLVAGPDIAPAVAAALAGIQVEDARARLERLADAHLIDEPAPARFAFHDLLRAYATERAYEEPADAETALARLHDHYLASCLAVADAAYSHLQRVPLSADESPPTRSFPDAATAISWADAELVNLVAAVRASADRGPRRPAWLIADALRGYFWLRRCMAEWFAVAEAGLSAALADDDATGTAAAHLSLATAYRCVPRTADARDHCAKAGEFARRAGWASGEAAALATLGILYCEQGQLDQAVQQHREAAAIFRRNNITSGEAVSWNTLGDVYHDLGQLSDALECHRTAYELFSTVDSPSGQALALNGQGKALSFLGHHKEAIVLLERARLMHRQVANRDGEAAALIYLGEAHRRAGHDTLALDVCRQAVALAQQIDEHQTHAQGLNTRARVHAQRGEYEEALRLHTAALEIADAASIRYCIADALAGLAGAHLHLAKPGPALKAAERALALARSAGFRLLEDTADTAAAQARAALGQSAQGGPAASARTCGP